MQNCTTFYRPLKGLSIAQQRRLCEDAAERLGLTIATALDTETIEDAREEWIKHLGRRRKEVGMVAKLEVIAETRDTVKRPTADFADAILAAVQTADFVVEAASGITSRDGRAWRELVKHAGATVASGRLLAKRVAADRATKRWAKALPGTVERWRDKRMAAERERWSQHWRDPAYSSARAAFNAFPDALQQEFGSVSTARRIFDERKPGDKSAGGRPRKQP